MIDAEAKPGIAARRHHESLDLVCGARPNCAVRRGMHRAHPRPPIPERSASSFVARTGLPAVDINNTAASIMPSRIIETSYCRRSLKTVPEAAAIGRLRDALGHADARTEGEVAMRQTVI